MKTTVAIFATFVILALAAPAHADVWDFSWVSTAMFGQGPDGSPPINRQATGTATATITAVPDGIQINFPSPPGTANVHVFSGQTSSAGGNFAIGAVPMFFTRDGALGIESGSSGGSYTFSGGTFANPDTFSVGLSSGGSGPAGVERFSGTGTRHVAATAAEPMSIIVVAAGLLSARMLGRRRR